MSTCIQRCNLCCSAGTPAFFWSQPQWSNWVVSSVFILNDLVYNFELSWNEIRIGWWLMSESYLWFHPFLIGSEAGAGKTGIPAPGASAAKMLIRVAAVQEPSKCSHSRSQIRQNGGTHTGRQSSPNGNIHSWCKNCESVATIIILTLHFEILQSVYQISLFTKGFAFHVF